MGWTYVFNINKANVFGLKQGGGFTIPQPKINITWILLKIPK